MWLRISMIIIVSEVATAARTLKLPVFQNPLDLEEYPFQNMVIGRGHTSHVYFGGVNRLYKLKSHLTLDDRVDTEPVDNSPECPSTSVVDRRHNDHVYLTAVNRLYQLNADLTLEYKVDTGPVDDSPECPSTSVCELVKKSPTNNYNKALTIHLRTNKLIACGSVRQGLCRLHNIYNITTMDPQVPEPVVANDKDSSSVIFVAHGLKSDVLYVASTYTDLGPYRDEVPAVATLSLQNENLFKVAHRTINSETQIFVEHSKRKSYKIDYVYGFSSGNFSYFLTRQQTSSIQASAYQSKLVRLCQRDKQYHSYTEIPLQCKNAEDGDFNLVQSAYVGKAGYDLAQNLSITVEDDVLFAVFVKGDGDHYRNVPSRSSALCAYSLKSIEAKFTENIKLCSQGEVNRGLEFFKKDIQCSKTVHSLDTSCVNDVNYPLGGNLPVTQQPAFVVKNEARLTSVVSTTTHVYTVVFIGTDDGQLKKIVIETPSEANEYESVDLEVGKLPIIDLQLGSTRDYIYVLTSSSVRKVKPYECEQYRRCTTCLAAKDPYCGWCSSQIKCIAVDDSKLWKSYKDAQCTTITKVNPDKIPITQADNLNLEIQNLPAFSGQLSCVFTLAGLKLPTGAQKTANNTVNCATPQTSSLPPIPPGQNSLPALLSVQTDNGADFAETNFTFFDCSSYKSCTDCASASFLCDWCVESSLCVQQSAVEDKCQGLHLINSLNRQGPSSRRGPSFCPGIIPLDEPELYLPSGTPKEIIVKASNLMNFQSDLICRFEFNGKTYDKKATKLDNDQIKCESIEFFYSDSSPNSTAKVSVLWTEGKTARLLDNSQHIRVNMYKCERLATNCGLCLHLNTKYECGWCSDRDMCTTSSKCESANKFLDRSAMCPGPIISSFSPKSGPVEGGTRLTINGINLGRSFEDIKANVSANYIPCAPVENLYQVSTRIVCETGQSYANKIASGSVVIQIRGHKDYLAISSDSYSYVDPVIQSFDPLFGQQSGGTLITIFGENLDAGSNISANIAGIDCTILEIRHDKVKCKTGASTLGNKGGGVQMKFDNALRSYTGKQFTYDLDPQVTSLNRYKSIASGGLNIDVTGQRFNLVQEPKFFLSYNGKDYSSVCKTESNEKMKCLTPKVGGSIEGESLVTTQPIRYDYWFRFDGIDSQTNSAGHREQFFVYPDPILEPFSDTKDGRRIKYFKENSNDYLIVTGINLNHVVRDVDVRVYVGMEYCNVSNRDSVMTCKPPLKQPKSVNGQSGPPEVFVVIGDGALNLSLGFLDYGMSAVHHERPFEVTLAIIIVPTIFIISAIIVIVMFYVHCRKSTLHKDQMKHYKVIGKDNELEPLDTIREQRGSRTGTQQKLDRIAKIQRKSDLLKCVTDVISAVQPPTEDESEPNSWYTPTGFMVSQKEKFDIFLNVTNIISDILPTIAHSTFSEVSLISSLQRFMSFNESYTVGNLHRIGNGNFGEVYRGSLKYNNRSSNIETYDVALKRPIDEDGAYCLKVEWALLLYIGKHDNVVNFVEAITKPSPLGSFALITEFCELGDMKNYISKYRHLFKMPSSKSRCCAYELEELLENNILCFAALFMYAAQIANGFCFLAERNVLHRDLALQNMLLTRLHVVKINDFGLAVWGSEYHGKYRTKFQTSRLPPESLYEAAFTEKSDVWSFGILLTELFSLARHLDFSKLHDEFKKWLLSGDGYEIPRHATHKITDLIINCGSISPENRPTFLACQRILLEALQEQSKDMFRYVNEKIKFA